MRAKVENFWYHYKWHTIISVFLVFVAVIGIWQYISTPQYDYQIILYTSRSDTTALATALNKELCALGDDINGDGEVNVQIYNMSYGDMDSNSNFRNSQAQALRGELMSDRCFLIITDEDRFEQLDQQGYFENSQLPDNNGKSYRIDDKSAFGQKLISDFNEMNYNYDKDIENGLYFSVRYANSDDAEIIRKREEQKQLLYKIMEVN